MTASNWDSKTLFDFAQKHWNKPVGLIVAIIGLLLFEAVMLNTLSANVKVSSIVYLITISTVVIIWYQTNKLPQTPKDKVGFVVCISSSNEKEKQKIREDFIISLRSLIKNGSEGKTFHFIEIPQHVAEEITDKDKALELKNKTKSHFVIFGRVRFRKIDGKDCYHLNLEGVVGHKPIADAVSLQISKEFSELFPRKVTIPTDNDLLSFTFTSEWTEFVAKYIIGIAAFCSGDLNYAEKLYTDLQKRISLTNDSFPVFVKLKERLPFRLTEIYLTRALSLLDNWMKNQDGELLALFTYNLNKIGTESENNYSVLILRSIEAFLNGRRINESKVFIRKCKKVNDVIWHFNLAFLEAYNGNLQKAIQQYRKCTKFPIYPKTLSQIEDFLCWIAKEESTRYQYHYCLGFFNWKIKGDKIQAIKDFKHFLACDTEGKFQKENELAIEWIDKIEKKK